MFWIYFGLTFLLQICEQNREQKNGSSLDFSLFFVHEQVIFYLRTRIFYERHEDTKKC